MQKIHWCDFKGIEHALSNKWTIEKIYVDQPVLESNGKTPFFVVFNVPEPATETEQAEPDEEANSMTAPPLVVWYVILSMIAFAAGMLAEKILSK